MKTIKTEITYKIQEHQFNMDGDGSFFDLTMIDAGDDDWSMTFTTLADAYAKVGAFAGKYHLGMTVNTVQAEPIYHYERP
jgi:hypothetical protein